MDQRLLLESLHPIKEASFDSYRLGDEGECLEGTRTELLSDIASWGSALSSPCIFWLDGMAGTGKSTISRTASASFSRQGTLAASFFFKRGAGDQGNARRLFTTISWQLASTIPSLPTISAKMIEKQFYHLLLQPLRGLKQHEHKKPCFVIVIDALDECDGEGDIEVILKLLPTVKEIKTLNIRFLLTSRPELPTLLGFRRLQEKDRQHLILQEIAKPMITRDISLFLEHKLRKIKENRSLPKEWPGKEKFQTLVTIATPLFIFAATVCRFLEDLRWSPEERLDEFFESPAIKSASEMERTYVPILNQLLTGRNEAESNKLKQDFHDILGVVILLAEPLSVKALAKFVNQRESTVRARLESFRSVLSVPRNDYTPVQTLHLSFRDFLVNTQDDYRIDEPRMHAIIASHCIRVMDSSTQGLRQNICRLPSYGTQRTEIDEHVVHQHIPAEMQYSCRYWVYHLEQGEPQWSASYVFRFLEKHFLHWLEAMSLIGLISEAVNIIRALEKSMRVGFEAL
jgi:hypothetical protein